MPLARNRANSSQSPARPNLTEIPLTPPILTQISPHSSLASSLFPARPAAQIKSLELGTHAAWSKLSHHIFFECFTFDF